MWDKYECKTALHDRHMNNIALRAKKYAKNSKKKLEHFPMSSIKVCLYLFIGVNFC